MVVAAANSVEGIYDVRLRGATAVLTGAVSDLGLPLDHIEWSVGHVAGKPLRQRAVALVSVLVADAPLGRGRDAYSKFRSSSAERSRTT